MDGISGLWVIFFLSFISRERLESDVRSFLLEIWRMNGNGVSILEIDLNFRDEKVYSFLHLWMGIKMYYPISREFIDIVHLDERRIEIYRIEILMLESGKFISI